MKTRMLTANFSYSCDGSGFLCACNFLPRFWFNEF